MPLRMVKKCVFECVCVCVWVFGMCVRVSAFERVCVVEVCV